MLCQRKKAKLLINIVKKRRKKLFVCDWKMVGHTVGSWRSLVLRVRARLLLGYGKAKMERVLRIIEDVGRRSILAVQKKKMLICEPYGRFTVTTEHFWSVNGWVQEGNQEYDYGAIILNSTIGNNTGYFGFRYDPNDTINQKPILNTGYPSDRNGTQWYMKGIVDNVQAQKVYYKLDTMEGNSGGPVCLGETNQVICIHAYGGCAATGSNSGTRINRDVYANVLKWKEAGASPQASPESEHDMVKE